MKVKKCDVCGAVFEGGDYNVSTSSRIKLRGQDVGYGEGSSGDRQDLCPDCTKALLSWLLKRRWGIKGNEEKDGGSNG